MYSYRSTYKKAHWKSRSTRAFVSTYPTPLQTACWSRFNMCFKHPDPAPLRDTKRGACLNNGFICLPRPCLLDFTLLGKLFLVFRFCSFSEVCKGSEFCAEPTAPESPGPEESEKREGDDPALDWRTPARALTKESTCELKRIDLKEPLGCPPSLLGHSKR